MQMRFVLALCALAAVLVRSAPAQEAADSSGPRVHLLAIGVNEYGGGHNLRGAVNDARAIADSLRQVVGELSIHLLLDHRATRPGIDSSIRDIVRTAREDDVFVFFFAGHGQGTRAIGGPYLFLPGAAPFDSEGDAEPPDEQVITPLLLRTWLNAVPAGNRFMILDTDGGRDFFRAVSDPKHNLSAVANLAAVTVRDVAAELATPEGPVHGRLTHALLRALSGMKGFSIHAALDRVIAEHRRPDAGVFVYSGGDDIWLNPEPQASGAPWENLPPEELLQRSLETFSDSEKALMRRYLADRYRDHIEGIFAQAWLLGVDGDSVGEERKYRRALELSPDHKWSLNNLAVSLPINRRRAMWERLLVVDPAHNSYAAIRSVFFNEIELENRVGAERFLAEWEARLPGAWIFDFIRGIDAGEDLETAERHYGAAIEKGARDFEVFERLLRARNVRLDWVSFRDTSATALPGSVEPLREYTRRTGDAYHPQMLLGSLYADFGNRAAAVEAYRVAFDAQPTAEALAAIYNLRRRPTPSWFTSLLGRAEAVLSHNPLALSVMARYRSELQEDMDAARQFLERAVALAPTSKDDALRARELATLVAQLGAAARDDSLFNAAVQLRQAEQRATGVTAGFSAGGPHVSPGAVRVVPQLGHLDAQYVWVAVNHDGSRLLSYTEGLVIEWDVATATELRRFEVADTVVEISYAPAGRGILTIEKGIGELSVSLRHPVDGSVLERHPFSGVVGLPRFSHDGRLIAVERMGSRVWIWDVETRTPLRVLPGALRGFSPDSRFVATTTGVWEVVNGKRVADVSWDESWLDAFSADRNVRARGVPVESSVKTSYDEVLSECSGAAGTRIEVFNTSGGSMPATLRGRIPYVTELSISAAGRLSVSRTTKGPCSPVIWDLLGDGGASANPDSGDPLAETASLRAEEQLPEHLARQLSNDFSGITIRVIGRVGPEWAVNVTGLIDIEEGRWASELWLVRDVRGSGVGTRVLASFRERLDERERAISFGADKLAALVGEELVLWASSASGEAVQEVVRIPVGDGVNRLSFSPEGDAILTAHEDRTARLWDFSSGALRQVYSHARSEVGNAWRYLSPANLAGSFAGDWNSESPAAIPSHASIPVASYRRRGYYYKFPQLDAVFLPDRRHVVTGGADGTVRIWDRASGRELVRLFSFEDDSWAVIDRDGRFDASNGGNVQGLHFVVGDEPIDLRQLKDRYYEPGLLAKILGHNKEPLRDVETFGLSGVDLYPAVSATVGADGRLALRLTNRGGGIGRVVVSINGKEVEGDARTAGTDPRAPAVDVRLNLGESPLLVPGAENNIQITAYNADGYLASRGFDVPYMAPAREMVPVTLWALTVGVSDYSGTELDLSFAAKDAQDFAEALRVGAENLFGAERTRITTLSTSPGFEPPTRTNILAALEAMRQAAPTDILVVYFAGHGTTHGGQDGDFYFLTRDAASGGLSDPALRAATAISSEELTALIKQIPALKQVLILDTCHSGRLVERLSDSRTLPSSRQRALERLSDRTGLYILAGTAADAVAYEASRFGQGLLTYSLLMGMRGAALYEERHVDVGRLLEYASNMVPELAQGIGGIQRPVLSQPRGGASFAIGFVESADRARIPLAEPRPIMLRASFQDERQIRDHLGLTQRVNEALREVSARGRDNPVIFVDAEDYPLAYQLAGRYRIEEARILVDVVVFRGDEERARFQVEGHHPDLSSLSHEILAQARLRIAAD